jgi:hypothetical protein
VPAQFDGVLIYRRHLYLAELRGTLAQTYALRAKADYSEDLVTQTEANHLLRRTRTFVQTIVRDFSASSRSWLPICVSTMEGKAGNTLEVPEVLGDEGKVVVQSGGGDEDIRITNQFTPSAQIAANPGKLLHDPPVQRDHVRHAKKLAKNDLVLSWVRSVVNPFVNFAVGNQTDRQA